MKKIYTIISATLFCFAANAQTFQWAFNLGVATLGSSGTVISRDASGNIYVTGTFQGTVDFDPGVGVANLTSAGSVDAFFAKYTSSGNYVWAFKIGGASADRGNGIATDAAGNVYIAGDFQGTVDFNPGVGIANLTPVGGTDIFLGKYDASGNYLWAFNVGSSGSGDQPFGLTIDATGNSYVTGWFTGTADFDPGVGTANLTVTVQSMFVAKYNTSGNYQWAFALSSGGGNSQGQTVILDGGGNVLVTGMTQGTVDADPGVGVANVTSNGSGDVFVGKYTSSGTYMWAFNIGSTTSDVGFSVSTDASNNVVVTGNISGTTDFDPGIGVANINLLGSGDAFVAKYNSSGNYLWAFTLGSSGNTTFGNDLNATSGNIYVTGQFQSTTDFDPGVGVANLTSGGMNDVYLAKYDTSGNYIWAFNIGAGTNDVGQSICTDALENVFVTGYFTGTSDFDPSVGVANLTPIGTQDLFIGKYCQIPIQPSTISGATTVCNGTTNTYSIAPVSGATSYTWTLPGGWTGTSTTNSINTTASATSGNIAVTANNACGNSSAQTLAVLVNPLPVVTYSQSPALVCINATSVALGTVTPVGGVFTGTAVTGSTFNASTAGTGTFNIT